MIDLVDLLEDTRRRAPVNDTVRVKRANSPVVHTVPHAGTEAPAELVEPWNLDRRALLDADLHTEKLYEFVDSSRITTTLNRYAVNMNRPRPTDEDVERYEDEDALRTFLKGMEKSWSEPLPRRWKDRLLTAYDSYHDAVKECLDTLRDRHGFVLLLTCHSMNAHADSNTPDTGKRPQVSLCTEHGDTAGDHVIQAMQAVLDDSDFESRKNDPYAGGHTTNAYADPSANIHGVQIEVSKAVYMDEASFEYDERRAGELKQVLQAAKTEALSALKYEKE